MTGVQTCALPIYLALSVNARIIGVNNRNLKDFSVDTENSKRLHSLIPDNVLFVSESGVKDENDVLDVRNSGADAVLIGEAMMRSGDKRKELKKLKSLL